MSAEGVDRLENRIHQSALLTRREMLALSASAVLSTTGGLSCKQGALKKPNIILFLSDTLRADHLSSYGYPVPTSPVFDAFCEDAILFESCYSQSPWTKPSVGSLFTGVLPRVHQSVITTDAGIEGADRARVQILRERFSTLAEGLQGVGYSCAAFVANAHLHPNFGYARGFHHYYLKSGEEPAELMSKVVHWLNNNSTTQPFFVYVHILDPHHPYWPDADRYLTVHGKGLQASRGALSPADKTIFSELLKIWETGVSIELSSVPDLSPRGMDYLISLYDAEISYVDIQLKRLLRAVESTEVADNTVIAVTSDHGEAFMEHGLYMHGYSPYDEEIHVPLAIRHPRNKAGVRVPHSVSQFDLYSTLLGLAGAHEPDYVQSSALLGPDGALAVDQNRAVFTYVDRLNENPNAWDVGMVLGDQKLIRYAKGSSGGVGTTHYDRAKDPEEKHNLLAGGARPQNEQTARLVAMLEASHATTVNLANSLGEPEWTVTEAEYREEIEALGYL